jgi:AraC-like DNA-binding protein
VARDACTAYTRGYSPNGLRAGTGLRVARRVDVDTPIPLGAEEQVMDDLVRSLLKCVRRRLDGDEDLTVQNVSEDLGFTRQYVSGRFHRATGRLLSQFLKEKRLEKAARLLKSGKLKVSQISHLCGFESENYFRQQFRSRYGMSPRQFRANGKMPRAGRGPNPRPRGRSRDH